MNKNKKMLAVLSVPALASLVAVAVATPVKAANRDFYDISTTPQVTTFTNADYSTKDDVLNNLLLATIDHPTKLVYEFGQKYYNYDTLVNNYNTEKAKDGATAATAFTASLVDTPFTTVSPIIDTTKLTVTSVTALNAKQVKVTFNKAVDSKLASDISNYSVYAETDTAQANDLMANGSVTLSADKASAVLTLGHPTSGPENQLTNYTSKNVVVVKKALGFDADQTNSTVALTDTTVPELVSAQQNGPRQIKLIFSEPVTNVDANKISIDDGAYALGGVSTSYKDNAVLINTYADLTAGQHSVKLSTDANGGAAAADFSGLKVTPKTVNFTYTKDTSAPVATLVSSTENKITLKFNKPVDLTSKTSVVQFSHSYKGLNLGNVSNNPQDTDNTLFDVHFGVPFAPGNTTVYFDYVSGTKDADKVQDNYGNILAPTTFTFSTVADTTAPTIADASSIKVIDATHLDVTFSKEVDATTAQAISNYSLKDATGSAISIYNVAKDSKDGTLVHLTTATMNGGAFTLDAKNIKDTTVAGNTMVEKAIAFNVKDLVPPTVVDLDNTGSGDVIINSALLDSGKKVRIAFSEQMDKSSIENKDNYFYNGSALPSGTVLTASSDLKSVVIDFTTASPAVNVSTIDDTHGDVISVGRVQDLAGNKIANLVTPTIVASAQGPSLAKEADGTTPTAYAISSTQVKLVFDRAVSGVKATDFQICKDGSAWVTPNQVVSVTTDSNGRSVVVLQVANGDKFATSAHGVSVKTAAAGVTTKDEYGKVASIGATPVQDKAGVESFTATTADTDGNGELDTITLAFAEPLYAASINNNTFSVAGYTVKSVKVNDAAGTVVLTLNESGLQDSLATPKVSIAGTVEDAKQNPNASIDPVTPTSGVVTSRTSSITALGVALDSTTPMVVSADGTSATVNVASSSATMDVSAVATNLITAGKANEIKSVSVGGQAITIAKDGAGNVNVTDLADKIVKALNGSTSVATSTTLNDLIGKSVTVNGVTYTINIK